MAMVGVALEAEQAQRSAGLDQAGQLVHLGRRRLGRQVRLEDPAHVGVAAAAGGEAAVRWRAEAAQMEVVDPDRGDAGRELALGEAGPARGGDGADVDQQADAGGGQGPDAPRPASIPGSRW